MRVLHIIDTLWLGGAQTVERDYFKSQQNNPDIFLYVLRKSMPQITINHKNVAIEESFSRYSLSPIFRLNKFIKENDIEILHCHLLRSHVFGYLVKGFFNKSIKLIIHEHSDIIDNEGLSVPILRLIQKRVNLFITCSNSLRKTLIEKIKIGDAKAIVMYNGIDLKKFDRNNLQLNKGEERKKLSIEENTFIVGFVGRLTKRKGWEELLEAALLLKDNSSIKFLIAGDGEDKEKLLNLISSKGLGNVIYLGYAPNMQGVYSILDCLAIPSHYEPMGITAIEAQAIEVPVIASNVDGLNEIITNEENALLINPQDAESIKTAILRLQENEGLCTQLKNEGKENAKRYSIENYAKALDNIYNSIIST
jgi:glycosyltransferase involved in cell wall biosynthesis